MAIVQKERTGASARSVEAVCTAGVRCEISSPEGHTIITDEPVPRYRPLALGWPNGVPCILPGGADRQGGRGHAV